MSFCPECGKEIADDDKFCKSCGKNLEDVEDKTSDNKIESSQNESSVKPDLKENKTTNEKNNNLKLDNRTLLIPLILGVIGVFIGIGEGLSCPMLMGWENIVCEMISAILGGCLGIILYHFQKEYLIAGIEFIITGILMVFFISNLALIGGFIFIIAGVLAIFLTKKLNADNKLLFAVPVATVIIVFLIIIVMAGMNIANQNSLSDSVSIDNVNNSIELSYGYYDGNVKGDIHFNKTIDYISMEMVFLDENGKILTSTYPLDVSSVEEGKTYQFDAFYMEEEKPYTAQISLKNDVSSDEPFYIQNITLN